MKRVISIEQPVTRARPMARDLCRAIPLGLLLILSSSGAALAQADPNDRLRTVLRETTTQLRDAQDELGRLRAENESLKSQTQNQASNGVIKGANPVVPATLELEGKVQRQGAELQSLRQQLDASKSDREALVHDLDQTEQSLAAIEQSSQGEKARAEQLEIQLDTVSGRVNRCADDNASLVGISQGLLDRYREKGVWSALRNEEPVTAIHRVQLEVLSQQYHAQIKDCSLIAIPAKVSAVEQGQDPSSRSSNQQSSDQSTLRQHAASETSSTE